MGKIMRADVALIINNCLDRHSSIIVTQEIAEKLLSSDTYSFDDWEGQQSLSEEILHILASSDVNLIVLDDILFFSKIINESKEETSLSIRKLDDYFKLIDYKSRKKELRQFEFYRMYC